MCGTLFRQIILTFHPLFHLKGRFSRLTYRRFYYVISLSFFWAIVSVTCGLIIQFTHMFTRLCNYFYVYVFMCENKDHDDDRCMSILCNLQFTMYENKITFAANAKYTQYLQMLQLVNYIPCFCLT